MMRHCSSRQQRPTAEKYKPDIKKQAVLKKYMRPIDLAGYKAVE